MNLSSCQRSVFGAILGPLFYLALVGGLEAQAAIGVSPIQKTPGQTAKGSSSGSGKKVKRFEKEIQKIEKKTAPLPMGTILLTGSSSIGRWKLAEYFPGIQTANHGFGGSQTDELLHFAPRILIKFKPTTVVIYEGDNDLAQGKTPMAIRDCYQKLLDLIAKELPTTKVFCLAVKPSPSRIQRIDQQRELNALLQRMCHESKNARFVDGFSPLLDDKGQPLLENYQADKLHLSPKGYAKWTEVMTQVLKDK